MEEAKFTRRGVVDNLERYVGIRVSLTLLIVVMSLKIKRGGYKEEDLRKMKIQGASDRGDAH